MALTMGGCICVPSDEERINDMATFVRRARADMTMISPTFLSTIDPKLVPTLKTVVLVGEPVPLNMVRLWEKQATVMNGYGPGGCTFCSTTIINAATHSVATVGKPTGCRFWIVDMNDRSRLAPIGVVGEILIQGPTLARGYLKDPDKTEAAFTCDLPWLATFPLRNYRRTYLSGDLGRYNADGSVVYVGRSDAQIKLRGQRIELGEVNFHLTRAVSQEAVAEVVTYSQKPQLTAFIVVGDGDDNSSTILPPTCKIANLKTIIGRLESQLPSFMVPTVFLPISKLPRTVSGKFDRKLLWESAASLTSEVLLEYRTTQSEVQQPATPAERNLREIWASLLGLKCDAISRDDSFFHIGGNSVDAMRLVSVARQRQMPLSVATIFKNPRLSAMAKACSSDQIDREMHVAIAPSFAMVSGHETEDVRTIGEPYSISPDRVIDVYPATHDQAFEFESNHCVYARFTAQSRDEVARLVQSWATVVASNDILRTVLVPGKEFPWAVVLRDVHPELEQSTAHIKDLRSLVEMDSANRMGPGKPLFLLYLIDGEKERPSLVLKMSHAIFDGCSLPNIWEAWQAAYTGSSPKPRCAFQNVLYSRQAFATDASIQYWRKLLNGSKQTQLPISQAQAHDPVTLRPSSTITRSVHGVRAPLGCVTDALLKAGWCATLSRLTQETDIVFCQISNGRRTGGTAMESAIGPLYQVVPVRIQLSSVTRVVELCHALQEQDSESMGQECLSDQEIWACTDWPQDMVAGSIFDHVKRDLTSSLILDGEVRGPEVIYHEGDQEELTVLVESQGEDVNITFTVPGHMDTEMVRRALEEYCSSLERFSADPNGSVF